MPVVGSEDTRVPLPPRDVADRIPQAFSRIVECTVAPCSPGLGEGFFWPEGQLTAPHRVATELCPCKERELVSLKTGFAVSREWYPPFSRIVTDPPSYPLAALPRGVAEAGHG